uniref:Uncharacterized protein n=1 Tax=Ixodes ricinus TaxID=34613 RepID=A0A0K8R5K0_IXORI
MEFGNGFQNTWGFGLVKHKVGAESLRSVPIGLQQATNAGCRRCESSISVLLKPRPQLYVTPTLCLISLRHQCSHITSMFGVGEELGIPTWVHP